MPGEEAKTEKDIAEALPSNDQLVQLKGETLPQDQGIYCVKVVTTFLCSGVPLNKIPVFRELLEEHAFRLTDRRHMSDIVPFIWSQKQAQIKNKINEKPLSIVFDGTSRLGEALAVTVRFIDPEWSIQQ